MLTICANEELFYTRRLELPENFMSMTWTQGSDAEPNVEDGFSPVQEYVPDYSVGGASYGSDYSAPASMAGGGIGSADIDRAQRFLVEVQRSLDLWDRSWSSMPLAGLRVYAGARTQELADWLTRDMGQVVQTLDIEALFPGMESVPVEDQHVCFPLLGLLMRTEARNL